MVGMDSKDTGMKVGNFPSLSYPSHGTLGWDGYRLETFPVCHTVPMVHWDGMGSKYGRIRMVPLLNSTT